MERELGHLVCVSEVSNEFQPKEIRFQRIPPYLAIWQDRPHHMAFLGGQIAAKVMFTNCRLLLREAWASYQRQITRNTDLTLCD